MNRFVLKLYISGQTWKSQQAVCNLERICRNEISGDSELVVIDVLEQPQLAEDDQILATPTLVRELPLPVRCIVGDLSDFDKVRMGLGLEPNTNPL
jgi:circadian clock protein KaiB